MTEGALKGSWAVSFCALKFVTCMLGSLATLESFLVTSPWPSFWPSLLVLIEVFLGLLLLEIFLLCPPFEAEEGG